MPATVVDAVQLPLPCACRCHEALTLDERAAGIAALYRFDDAMRGWGPTVIWDLHQHPRRYESLARKLKDEAREWFTLEVLDSIAARFEAAEAIGVARRPRKDPPPREVARIKVKAPGRNDLCLCGSMRKWKQCCGALA